jgi:hypothetical protein
MQVIKKERINVYEVYAAMDGTEFNTIEECRKYENSAKCVLLAKYKEYCDVIESNEEDIFYVGSCDNTIDIVKMNKPEAVSVILQLISLYNPNSCKGDMDNRLKMLQEYYEKGSTFFISRGYDEDEFWLLKYDLEDRLNHIAKMCNLGKVIINDSDEIN